MYIHFSLTILLRGNIFSYLWKKKIKGILNLQDQHTPQYRKLYELLRRHIVDGLYREGDLLPSENELSRIYGMARPTVRHALDELVKDGFIRKQHGKGSIVHPLPKGIGILSIAGTTSAIGQKNLETHILQKPEISHWPEPFIFPLPDLIRESGCIYMKRLRLVEGKPLFLDITWIPNINLPRFTARKFENRSLFDTLRKHYRIEVTGGEQRLRAIRADKDLAALLTISTGNPVLHLERKIDTNRTGFSFYSSLYCNTSGHALYGIF
ncbi:MAG: GntR family transcriptional regulator [Chlorobi bacterium]|nr:GntR family transcriptional regulator [Chlorobiota bacterium]